jgi:hypothetical protein
LCMTFAYRSTCYLFYAFTPLNMVHAELELEESMSELMTCHEVHDGGDLGWKMEGKKLDCQLCMTFVYRSSCYLFYDFTPLNTVYTDLELEEPVSELMTSHEVHDGGDLVWKMEGNKLNFQLYRTFAYCSNCYFAPLNAVHAEPELEESMSELMTGHEVHDTGNLDWKWKERS